jgi:hypothetical protein
VVVTEGKTVWEPFVALLPDQPLLAVQVEASVDDQVSVDEPPERILLGDAWNERVGAEGAGVVTVRLNESCRVMLPAVPDTVTGKVPVVALGLTESRSEVEHDGEHEPGENEADTPDGRPETEKDTGCDAPETSADETGWVSDAPLATLASGPAETEKSREGTSGATVTVSEATSWLATEPSRLSHNSS